MNFASEPKRRVLDHLKRGGAASTQAVAQALDVSNVAARQHLGDLVAMGIVTTTQLRPKARAGRPSSGSSAHWRTTSSLTATTH